MNNLPKYVIEKVGEKWEVYNTRDVVVEDSFDTEEEAEDFLKTLLKNDN